MEAGILAQQRVADERDEIGRWMAGREVARREPRGLRDLLLAVAGIEEGAPQLGRREAGCIVPARQAGRRDVEVAVEIDRERAMDGGAQA